MELVENQEKIVRRAQHGDERAFKTLFDAYQGPIYNFIFRMVGNQADAEDVTQEVFFKVYKRLGSLRKSEYFSTWLFSIAKNEAVSSARRTNRRAASSLDEFSDGQEAMAFRDITMTDPETNILSSEFERMIQKVLDEIPEIYRSAFILGAIQRYPYDEVAKILGCSVGNIKSRIFRAREQIAKKLKKYTTDVALNV